jgi:hypothetical protein
MNEPIFSSTDLERLGQQLESWRKRPSRSRRLPPQLWAAATDLAATYGVSLVSHFLRIDYRKLKTLAAPAKPARLPSMPPAPFVELKWEAPSASAPSSGWVELSDPSQAQLRIHTGAAPEFWLTLAQAFWRRGA